jgi:3-deoxy-D-manno-octulosonic-acid transferase
MFLIYSIIYTVAICLLFIPQYVKRPKAIRKKWLHEKMGFIPEDDAALWVHAVSVGEVNASIPLLFKLRDAYQGVPIILSTVTDTGQKVAKEKAPEGTRVVYLPFDIPFILERCIRRTKPKLIMVIETELWPNMFRVMAGNGVPVLVLNGRISENSVKGYRVVSFFMKKVFSYVSIFAMQAGIDAERLILIGAEKDRVTVIGNFKFDMNIAGAIPLWAEELSGPLVVAGSTHRGEEQLVLSVYRDNINRFPGLKIIIAPRHPERFKEVAVLLTNEQIPFVKRSELDVWHPAPNTFASGIILLDTVGELAGVYGAADVAIIGKSFTGFGGQNPLEPAYWGKPIVCGPHMENFPFIEEFYHTGAAFAVEAQTLSRIVNELLAFPEKAAAAGKAAREVYLKHTGAVDRAMEIVGAHLRN